MLVLVLVLVLVVVVVVVVVVVTVAVADVAAADHLALFIQRKFHYLWVKRLCALFKAFSGERVWKAIRENLRRSYYEYMNKVDHVQKIRDRRRRTDNGKYSFVNRTIKNWN